MVRVNVALVAALALACVAAAACSSRDAGGGSDNGQGAGDASADASGSAPGSDAGIAADSPFGADAPVLAPEAGTVVNPGGIDAAAQAKLRAGGPADPTFTWLYPYDGTVFPSGLEPPSMQWGGAAADAYYVQITTTSLRYEAFFGAGPPTLALDAPTWQSLATGAGATGTMQVAVTILRGGEAHGPIAATWTIAQAPLPGVLYYASLGAAQLNGNGAVMKLAFGSPAQIVAGGSTCMGCHAVSADGSTMIASYGDNNSGAIFDLTKDATKLRDQADSIFTWGALYPDGSLMMSNGVLAGGFPPNVSGQTQGPRPSRLYDPKTSTLLAASGWDSAITAALMPAFSPDGKKIAFNHYDVGEGKSLSVMDFDVATKTFSGMVDIAIDATSFLGWPSFTPDGARVVFQAGTRDDYVTEQGAKGDLAITSSNAQSVVKLDALNGYASGAVYLPYGEAEAHLNYWPAVAPVTAGGYAWVAFTSRREYGNTITNASQDDKERQKIWIAAIDLTSSPSKDPSHPAFFLPGQDMGSGNMRPAWTKK
jgi:hypothetical protein